MTKILKFALFIISIGSLLSCAATKQPSLSTKTLIIGSKQVDCTGVGPQKCYLVKEDGAQEWSNFYGAIEGFDYKEGYEYQIEVAVTEVDNPPADASSLNYKLVKILKETQDPYMALSATWVIESLDGKATDPLKTYILFDPTNDRISGYAGCNGLGGSMKYDAEADTLSAGPFMSTMMYCEEVAEHERALGKVLEQFNKFKVEGDVLTLYKDGKALVSAKKGENHRELFRNWEVTKIEGVADMGENIPNFFLSKDLEANGTGSCNNFKGKFELDAYSKAIKIGPLAATRMMCADNDVEGAFFMQIDKVNRYEVDGKELYLYQDDQLLIKAKRK
ncbi:META domain-containing protein [Flammeovirga sp. SJP92]|uniref:META domain-containing protein n=1 Tax=Flammeovirga sp. SJP92 TaxID=1775430 RepID=UPI000788F3BB|nr:META domain-containing protein [Flammeovirga sp. SJP92]